MLADADSKSSLHAPPRSATRVGRSESAARSNSADRSWSVSQRQVLHVTLAAVFIAAN